MRDATRRTRTMRAQELNVFNGTNRALFIKFNIFIINIKSPFGFTVSEMCGLIYVYESGKWTRIQRRVMECALSAPRK